jgi:hypothetical protein
MTNYNDEMFQFLATEENVEGLIIAKDQFEKVKMRLISEFWEEVLLALNTELIQSYQGWEVRLQRHGLNTGAKYPKLFIFNRVQQKITQSYELPSFMYCIENLNARKCFFGFWVNDKSEFYNGGDLLNYVSNWNEKLNFGYESKDDWYPLWTFIDGLDFNNDFTLKKLVETNRKEYISNIVSTVTKLFIETKDDYLELINDSKFLKEGMRE